MFRCLIIIGTTSQHSGHYTPSCTPNIDSIEPDDYVEPQRRQHHEGANIPNVSKVVTPEEHSQTISQDSFHSYISSELSNSQGTTTDSSTLPPDDLDISDLDHTQDFNSSHATLLLDPHIDIQPFDYSQHYSQKHHLNLLSQEIDDHAMLDVEEESQLLPLPPPLSSSQDIEFKDTGDIDSSTTQTQTPASLNDLGSRRRSGAPSAVQPSKGGKRVCSFIFQSNISTNTLIM